MISLPDQICLNDVWVAKSDLFSLSVRKYSFMPNEKQLLGKPLRENGFIFVFIEPNYVFLMRTDQQKGRKLPDGISLTPELGVEHFSDLLPDVRERMIFALIEKAAEKEGVYRAEGQQLFVHNKPKNASTYDALNVDIREEEDHYSIYLNPTRLIAVRRRIGVEYLLDKAAGGSWSFRLW